MFDYTTKFRNLVSTLFLAEAHYDIEQILQRRLGDIPPTVRDRLRHCTLTQLNTLVNPALDAATWDEFAVTLSPIVSKA
ncbi:MAG: hypothetical protein DYG89_05765 [Caldilinea sp. CFX5]|nr:hypothetical protein [Caldilinea sp. CFX5]